jgi:hypothetical protein
VNGVGHVHAVSRGVAFDGSDLDTRTVSVAHCMMSDMAAIKMESTPSEEGWGIVLRNFVIPCLPQTLWISFEQDRTYIAGYQVEMKTPLITRFELFIKMARVRCQ